jgi:membrane associated rhomboid family serine protease
MLAIDSLSGAWRVLGLPGLLHWNVFHLILNLLTFFLVGITLELSCGSGLFLLCYSVGHFLANSLTAWVIWLLIHLLPLQVFSEALSTQDVGASLGIWSCAGAWSYLLKKRGTVWSVFPGAVLLVGLIRGDFFQVNHIMAATLGLLVARLYFGKIHNEDS